jgi:hypothetical protein
MAAYIESVVFCIESLDPALRLSLKFEGEKRESQTQQPAPGDVWVGTTLTRKTCEGQVK